MDHAEADATPIHFLTRRATTSEDRRLIKQALLNLLEHADLDVLAADEREAILLLVV